MKIAVLTSSRADYSIWFPLLKKLFSDSFFNTEIIAFGTHLSKNHGFTVEKIIDDGFPVKKQIPVFPKNDSPLSIALAMGETFSSFSHYWSQNDYDYIFSLGDRFETFSAVAASVPFNKKIAHIHGGEKTKGAIDDSFRHSITHMSNLH